MLRHSQRKEFVSPNKNQINEQKFIRLSLEARHLQKQLSAPPESFGLGDLCVLFLYTGTQSKIRVGREGPFFDGIHPAIHLFCRNE
jgi:hypothetical protein